jgi:hypothetical protein
MSFHTAANDTTPVTPTEPPPADPWTEIQNITDDPTDDGGPR